MSEFWENYRHPNWQKKRLEIMQRDDFCCSECGDKETTLNVHHKYYIKKAKPWEYPDDALETLCEPCHEKKTKAIEQLKLLIGSLDSYFHSIMLGFAKGLLLKHRADVPGFKLHVSGEEIEGLGDAYSFHGQSAFSFLLDAISQDGTVDNAALMKARWDLFHYHQQLKEHPEPKE